MPGEALVPGPLGVAVAVIVVMAALVGAGVWVAIRVESGLAGPTPAPLRRRLRCVLGDNRRNAGGDHEQRRVRDAPVAGRGRGRDRVDEPAGRHRAGGSR